ncbi:phage portal protein [Burkholderia vietnamiensis]|uniref:phage portal protein n=1 Tax=Burkholderia vietnamiensis TaxID=60552 RepID=UPI0012DB28AD|nr:phage portal protein [Burkholderia vietnamiensis]
MSIRQRFSAAMQAFGRPELSAQAVTNPPSGTASPEGWFLRALGGGRSVSGQVVTPDSALRVMAVYAATRILAESMASLPISVYQADGTKRRRVSQHPLSTLLHDSPNPNNTAFEFVEMGQAHLGLRGNCYSWIDWSGKGEVQGLYPPLAVADRARHANRQDDQPAPREARARRPRRGARTRHRAGVAQEGGCERHGRQGWLDDDVRRGARAADVAALFVAPDSGTGGRIAVVDVRRRGGTAAADEQ